MKKGDKLICKKDHINYDYGKEYYITAAWSNIVFISNKNKDKGSYFTISGDYIHRPGVCYLWDYFYTEIELRKLKLDSINEGR